jgi:hypothetical protein
MMPDRIALPILPLIPVIITFVLFFNFMIPPSFIKYFF